MKNNSVGIIGFGRFGQTLAKILMGDYQINVYDIVSVNTSLPVKFVPLQELYKENFIFICVPIRYFKNTIVTIAPHLLEQTTVIDVCSIKIYPVAIMTELLPNNVDIIATHPLFGPDSLAANHHPKIMMHNVRDQRGAFAIWRNYFQQKHFQVIEMTPDEHDQQAAASQGVTHLIGRVLQEAGIKSTAIDTLGFQHLLTVMNVTCHDSWDLFYDLHRYNPYAKLTLEKIQNSLQKIVTKIHHEH